MTPADWTLSNNKTYLLAIPGRLYLLARAQRSDRCGGSIGGQPSTEKTRRCATSLLSWNAIPSPAGRTDRWGSRTAVTPARWNCAVKSGNSAQLLDWLKVEHSIAEPSQKLQSSLRLDSEAFVTEVRKARGKKNPLSLAALRSLREEHTRTILPAQSLAREALGLERHDQRPGQ